MLLLRVHHLPSTFPQVRLLATNLSVEDVLPVRDKLADALFAGQGQPPAVAHFVARHAA